MSDTPNVVEIDCSAAGAPSEDFVAAVRAEALALLEAGEVEKAAAVMAQAQQANEAAQLPPAVSRPLTADELAQHKLDQTAGAEALAAQQAADANADTMRNKVGQALANLEQAAASWGTLTAAQKDAAMKLTVLVTARLARLQLSQLDAAP